MTRLLIYFLIFLLPISTWAQPPDGYYSTTTGKKGEELLQELHEIIKGHTAISYNQIWSAFEDTDKREDGTVWDMYTGCVFIFGDDQDTGTGGNTECDVYNREHSFPSSWFGGTNPMRTDLFHIFPVDKKVNNVRDNYPFGEVATPTYTSTNGSKLGPSSYPGYPGVVFEPIDEYKGDLARAYFYMVTRYYDIVETWTTAMLNKTKYPAFSPWALSLLLEWHDGDPVSQKELDRNNVVYENYQGNRNPFIDYPKFAHDIWGNTSYTPLDGYETSISVWPNPAKDFINVSSDLNEKVQIAIYNTLGNNVLVLNDVNFNSINTINVSMLSNGVYLLSIKRPKDIQIVKIVINR